MKLTTIGDLSALPKLARENIQEGIKITKNNDGLNLILALNYGARQEITRSVNKLIDQISSGKTVAEIITEQNISENLYTNMIEDPDLLIRTGGERRISNFMLWQFAYTELFFSTVYWPEFSVDHFYKALSAFQSRIRRFGKKETQSHIV